MFRHAMNCWRCWTKGHAVESAALEPREIKAFSSWASYFPIENRRQGRTVDRNANMLSLSPERESASWKLTWTYGHWRVRWDGNHRLNDMLSFIGNQNFWDDTILRRLSIKLKRTWFSQTLSKTQNGGFKRIMRTRFWYLACLSSTRAFCPVHNNLVTAYLLRFELLFFRLSRLSLPERKIRLLPWLAIAWFIADIRREVKGMWLKFTVRSCV